ncbi:hypothetical protein PGB90_006071 [Kerria lacca]
MVQKVKIDSMIPVLNIKFIKENFFLISILIGVLVGIASGLILRQFDLSDDVVSILAYPGEIFLRALKLIILPFIICCVIIGTTRLNISQNKNIALRVIIFFFLTTLFNVILGISLGLILNPGGMSTQLESSHTALTTQKLSLLDSLLDVGRSGTNTLGLIFFFVLFGSILGTMEKQKKTLVDFFSATYDVLQKMLKIVIWFTSVCVASIICSKIVSVPYLWKTVQQLGLFIAISVSGLLFYQLVVAQLIYFIIVKKNPYKYYLGIMPAIMTGFATASKAATLPVMFKVLEDLKMNSKITQFVLPIGTINLNGSAQFNGFAMIFLAQMANVTLTINDIITLVFACTLASMSSAGVPSAAIVVVTLLTSIINISTENIGLLLSVDWLLDRFRTATNVLGDCYTVAVVQQLSQKELKEESPQNAFTEDIEMNTQKAESTP